MTSLQQIWGDTGTTQLAARRISATHSAEPHVQIAPSLCLHSVPTSQQAFYSTPHNCSIIQLCPCQTRGPAHHTSVQRSFQPGPGRYLPCQPPLQSMQP